MRVFAVSVCIN